jgi:hypothetical protein
MTGARPSSRSGDRNAADHIAAGADRRSSTPSGCRPTNRAPYEVCGRGLASWNTSRLETRSENAETEARPRAAARGSAFRLEWPGGAQFRPRGCSDADQGADMRTFPSGTESRDNTRGRWHVFEAMLAPVRSPFPHILTEYPSSGRIRSRVPDSRHRPRSAPSASLLLRSGAHIAEYAPLRCSSRLADGAAFGRVGPLTRTSGRWAPATCSRGYAHRRSSASRLPAQGRMLTRSRPDRFASNRHWSARFRIASAVSPWSATVPPIDIVT